MVRRDPSEITSPDFGQIVPPSSAGHSGKTPSNRPSLIGRLLLSSRSLPSGGILYRTGFPPRLMAL